MHELFELLKTFDLQTIIPLGLLTWFLNSSLKKELHKDVEAIKKENAETMQAIHKEFKFINLRLSRVEGTVYGKDIYKPSEAD